MKRASVIVVALMVLGFGGLAWAQQAKPAPKEAMEPPIKQLEAFRRGDFDTAYTFASAEIKAQFDRETFELMVKGGYPEIARSASASIVGSVLAPNGLVYLTLKIRGSNGKSIEALYELVLQNGQWKINGVTAKPDSGVI
ncbi:MAG TPA: DUF4864 domain-containing protein [Verrucomicrobiae bacterium]|nr:DUF4864 domain-containing protein [Verrucomicrobiae bacterium]